jgi:hypothetical protein
MAVPLPRLPRPEGCEHSVPLDLDAAKARLGQPATQVRIVADGTEPTAACTAAE